MGIREDRLFTSSTIPYRFKISISNEPKKMSLINIVNFYVKKNFFIRIFPGRVVRWPYPEIERDGWRGGMRLAPCAVQPEGSGPAGSRRTHLKRVGFAFRPPTDRSNSPFRPLPRTDL